MSSEAYFLDVRLGALLYDSSVFDLCNYPTADVLSPRASIHDRGGDDSSSRQSHVAIMADRNSRVLFLFFTVWRNSFGIFQRQAFPVLTEYPPSPVGQASEKIMWLGLR